MKKILLVLACCLGFVAITSETVAATVQETKQLTKEEKKAVKEKKKALEKKMNEMKDSVNREFALEALNERKFVIMARSVSSGSRTYNSPQSNMNFILVQDDVATIQIAFNNGRLGQNGLGGVTVEGSISDWKSETDKKGNVYVTFSVFGSGVSAQVRITLPEYSNDVSAVVSPNFSSNNLYVSGKLVPYNGRNNSKAFKGTVRP